jgi:hypothetical protein
MTEADWLASTDPQTMLSFLWAKTSGRKLGLFAVACARRIWDLLTDERSRKVVDVAERYSDGLVGRRELDAARRAAWAAERKYLSGLAAQCQGQEVEVYTSKLDGLPMELAESFFGAPAFVAARARWAVSKANPSSDREWLTADLIRDLFGPLPFRDIVLAPAVLAWKGATVLRLGQAAYEERHMPAGTLDNGLLAILADALEEAGCTNADILSHCRQPGEHVRGCWVVDLVLGKS